MPLRLRIVSDHSRELGEGASAVFGAAGGSIGRSRENDWVLPDPQRYVSSHHARVRCHGNSWFVVDLSTNGIYVNRSSQPIPRKEPYELRDGDTVRLGEYEIAITIDAEEVGTRPTRIERASRSETDIGVPLDLKELLTDPTSSSSGGYRPVDAFGQAAGTGPRRVLSREVTSAAGAAPAPVDALGGLQAFCRGAGIDAGKLPAEAEASVLHLAGQLLRESLLGLKDIEHAQQELRNRFGIETPPADPDDTRPSLARQGIEDLLIGILSQYTSRRQEPVLWAREAADSAKRHEQAVAVAMRSAFVEFIERLDPADLETRFERSARGSPDKWALYRDFYRNLSERRADHLPHTFVEAFAQAYAAFLATST